MSECDEVAENMAKAHKPRTMDEALAIVREAMPGESEAVISNVAYALKRRADR